HAARVRALLAGVEQTDLARLQRHNGIQLLRRPDSPAFVRRRPYMDSAAEPGERVPLSIRARLLPARAFGTADLHIPRAVPGLAIVTTGNRLYLSELPLRNGIRRTRDGETVAVQRRHQLRTRQAHHQIRLRL